MKVVALTLVLVTPQLAAAAPVKVPQTQPAGMAAFFSDLPVPSGDPSRWQWSKSTAARVIEFLGYEGQLVAHRPGPVAPRSLAFPRHRGKAEKPPADGRGLGGVLYLNWTTGLKTLTDLSVDVTFHTEQKPSAAVYLQLYDFPLIVPGTDVKVGQYFGFQYWFEKGQQLKTQFIWSRWNTRDKANAWVADGGWIESAGYENDFVGIRYPYQWGKGTYTAHVMMRETDEVGTWYELRIYDHQKAEWKKIGRLRFPKVGDRLPCFEDNGGSWVEVFGGTRSSQDVGLFHYSIGGVYTCGRTVRARQVELRYADKLPVPNCNVAVDPDGRRVHVMYGGQTVRTTPPGKYRLKPE